MKLYWPMADAITAVKGPVGKREMMFTSEAFISLDKALQQFSIWEEGCHHLEKAWIDVFEDDKQTGRLEVEKTWKVKEE